MNKLISVRYSDTAFNIALLVLRIGFGVLLAIHGYSKLTHFSDMQEHFMNFLGLGGSISLGLTIFAEFFCSLLLIVGLLTRLAIIPLIITMATAVLVAHHADVFGKGELATTYLLAYIAILLLGPGKFSLDAMMNKSTS